MQITFLIPPPFLQNEVGGASHEPPAYITWGPQVGDIAFQTEGRPQAWRQGEAGSFRNVARVWGAGGGLRRRGEWGHR